MGAKSEALSRLFEAYDKKITPGRMHYYEEWAKGLSPEMVKKIIDDAVKGSDFFPTVSRLYQLTSLAESITTKQTNVYYCLNCDGGFTAKDGKCPNCGGSGI